MRDLHAPFKERRSVVQGRSGFLSALVIYFSTFQRLVSFFFLGQNTTISSLTFLSSTNSQKPHVTCASKEHSKEQRASRLVEVERTHPRDGHLWCFTTEEMALWTVDKGNRCACVRMMMYSLVPDILNVCCWTAMLSILKMLVRDGLIIIHVHEGLASFFEVDDCLSSVSYTRFPVCFYKLGLSFIT